MKSQDHIKKIEQLCLLANEADALGLYKQADEIDKVAGLWSWITGSKPANSTGSATSASGSVVGGIAAMIGGGWLGTGAAKLLRSMGMSEEAAAATGGIVGLAPSFIPGGFLAKLGIGAAAAALGWALDRFTSNPAVAVVPEGVWHDALTKALDDLNNINKSNITNEVGGKLDELTKTCQEVVSAENATDQEKAYASNMLVRIQDLVKKMPALVAHAIDQSAESKGIDLDSAASDVASDTKPTEAEKSDPWGDVVKILHGRDASKYPYGINDDQAMAAMKELGATGNATSNPAAALDWLKQNP